MYLIVLNDFVSLKNSFCYVIVDYSYMCTRDVMLFYRNKGYTCNLLFFLLVLDVKAFSTLLTIEVLTHLKTSGRFLSVNGKT